MADKRYTPEIVVGIDFGMTCTGVAYSMAPDWLQPTTIQHWPSELGHENRNKVDTVLAYDAINEDPVAWGFLVGQGQDDLRVEELFKLWLDPAYKDELRNGVSVEEARKLFVDYMRCIYEAIHQHFDEYYTDIIWRTKRIEFLFSVPTTWMSPATIASTEKLVKKAGFGKQKGHVATISLTEAEAAAVYAAKQLYEKGAIFLVCDAGGGTTDVNTLKVKNNRSFRTELEPLSSVEGEPIGSTLIDFAMERAVAERLRRVSTHLAEDPEQTARKMISDRFRVFKCAFGSNSQKMLDLLLPVPGMGPGQNFPVADIRGSMMVITRMELQQIFDDMINRIFKLIDQEILKLQTSHPGETLSYLIVSGGFGSSPCLKQRLRERYERSKSADLSNAKSMKILSAKDPQLAVCHGLVINRIQEIRTDISIYAERCCRNSYGIVVRQLYDPEEHQGEDVVHDSRDKRKWAERQIHWFIKQGQIVSTKDGIRHTYSLKIDVGKERLPWTTHIVMSSLPVNYLPRSMKHERVEALCVLESRIDERLLKLKNRHWYSVKKQYYRADFDVKILVGPADIKFELWNSEGQISKEHEEIKVIWDPLLVKT